MFALRDSVLNRAPAGFPTGLIFGYAVVMPDVSFSAQSPEWESWQVIDHEVLKKSISSALRRVADEQRKLHPKPPATEPNASTLRVLQQLLRPDFEIVVTRGTQIEETELQLLHLTEEQFVILDTLADNERCLVEGAAGTGKTMLALEYARRSATAGRRTLLICFNRLLGDWLDRQVAESGHAKNLTARTLFQTVARCHRSFVTSVRISRSGKKTDKRRSFMRILTPIAAGWPSRNVTSRLT
ncbi:MAG: DNA/RNA helicase domain-containing protein [Limisphaerales bacterium]